MSKNIFYIIYHYNAKELPYMLCDSIKEVATALNYSESMIKHGLNKGYVYTTDDGLRFTVSKWNYKDLEGDL
jgi:hypothetical protein